MNKLIFPIFIVVAGFLVTACESTTNDQNVENTDDENIESITPQNSVAAIREMGGESMMGPYTEGDAVLFLSDLPITDAELVHVAMQTKLKTLLLDGTAITDAGLAHLEGLTNLKNLNVVGTKVTKDGVKKIEQSLPNCSVMSDWWLP